jgi:hypothetical protein
MPGTIDIILSVGIIVAVLALLGAVAQRWGVDSRESDGRTQERWFGGH